MSTRIGVGIRISICTTFNFVLGSYNYWKYILKKWYWSSNAIKDENLVELKFCEFIKLYFLIYFIYQLQKLV